MTMMNNTIVQNMGDTTLTKVFVGGLAWETPKEAMKKHFDKYGEILEAVIISDKLTGKSKGYGFVTFKDPEVAKKACEDPTPIINGRRANCNLAVLGARRPRSSNTTTTNPPPQLGVNVGPRAAIISTPANPLQWYYPATPFPQQRHQVVPFYGYSPTYIAPTDLNYNNLKVGYTGGPYMNGHFSSHVYPAGQAMMAMFPCYHYNQPQIMGLPAQMYPQTVAGPMPKIPTLISKPISIAHPKAVC